MRRVPYALAALSALLVAAPSHATPCPMLTDPAGDGHTPISPMPLVLQPTFDAVANSPALDIRSADLASGSTEVAVELRVAGLTQDVMTTFPVRWFVHFKVGTSAGWYTVSASRALNGTTYTGEFGTGASAVAIPVTAGVVTSTLRWEFPRSYVAELATPGATFHTIAATTGWFFTNADAAATTETYVDQDPGCITAA